MEQEIAEKQTIYFGKICNMEKYIINESKRDDLLLQYMELLNNNGINVTLGQVKSKLLNKFVVEGNIHNLSLRSNFYLAGVAKYYFAGVLTKNKDLSLMKKESWEGQDIQDVWNVPVCKKLDALIEVLRNAYIDTIGKNMLEPEDFGELPINELLRKYSKEIKKIIGSTTKEKESGIDISNNVGDGYTFEIMYSYEDCQKYNIPTSPGAWCITYGQQHYNSYVRWLDIHYVIFRKNGWEKIARPADPTQEPGWTPQKPQDAYGNSLIALLQSNKSPEPVYITSRWNHGSGDYRCEADHAYTKEEFQRITGTSDADLKRIYDIWKQTKTTKGKRNETKKEELSTLRSLKYMQMRINAGENPEKLFDTTNYIYGSQKINKGLFACSASISDTTLGTNRKTVYFLFDNGSIQFETIANDTTDFKLIGQQIIFIELGKDKHVIYSVLHHKVLKIDDVYYFKRVPQIGKFLRTNNEHCLFEVKQGKLDAALIDSETMEPLQLPNGSYWYNTILTNGKDSYYHKRNEIICDVFDWSENLTFQIVYDLSSLEMYFYKVGKKQFFNVSLPKEIPGMDNTDGVVPFLRDSDIPNDFDVFKFSIPNPYELERGGFYASYNFYNEPLQILNNGKPLNINGYEWFKSVYTCKTDRYNDTPENKLFIIDTGIGEFKHDTKLIINGNFTKTLSLDGKSLFFCDSVTQPETQIFQFLIRSKASEEGYILYDNSRNVFLLNPITNDLIFKWYITVSMINDRNSHKSFEYVFSISDDEYQSFPNEIKKYFRTETISNRLELSIKEFSSMCGTRKAYWIPFENSKRDKDTLQLNESDLFNMVRKSLSIILDKNR